MAPMLALATAIASALWITQIKADFTVYSYVDLNIYSKRLAMTCL